MWPLFPVMKKKLVETPGYVMDFVENVLAKEATILIYSNECGVDEKVMRKRCFQTEVSLGGK